MQHLAEHGVLRGVLEARACRPAHRPQPPGVGGREKVCESDPLVVLQAADVLLKNAHELVQGGVVQDQVLGVHVGQRLRAGLGRLLPQAEELRRRRLAPPGRQRGGGPGGRGVWVGGELRDGLPQLEGGGRQLFEGLEHGAAQHLLLARQDREGDPRQLLLAEGRAVGPTGQEPGNGELHEGALGTGQRLQDTTPLVPQKVLGAADPDPSDGIALGRAVVAAVDDGQQGPEQLPPVEGLDGVEGLQALTAAPPVGVVVGHDPQGVGNGADGEEVLAPAPPRLRVAPLMVGPCLPEAGLGGQGQVVGDDELVDERGVGVLAGAAPEQPRHQRLRPGTAQRGGEGPQGSSRVDPAGGGVAQERQEKSGRGVQVRAEDDDGALAPRGARALLHGAGVLAEGPGEVSTVLGRELLKGRDPAPFDVVDQRAEPLGVPVGVVSHEEPPG